MFAKVALLLAGAAASVLAAYPGAGVVSGDVAVHDPSMCRDGNGKYFLFATAPGISIRTSTDRTKFSYVGEVFPSGSATWTDKYTGTSNGNLWAPECYWDGSKFWLYYSASSFGTSVSAIFLATSPSGNPGTWTNKGEVWHSTANSNYNSIDPNLLIISGQWYLSLGSFWSGIKLIELHPSNGLAKSTSVTDLAARPNNGGALEASTLYKSSNGWYYLFTSWDKCCNGLSSTYSIHVGRSKHLTGPYLDKANIDLLNGGGSEIFATHGSIVGPGGQDILEDADGPLLVYHYYVSTGSALGLNKLDFSTGWPVVV